MAFGKIENVCKEIVSGGDKPKNFSKESTYSLQVPVYANGVVNDGLQGFTDKAVINEPCVTISARGTLGFCAYHEIPFVPIVRLIVATPNEKVDVKYLYYTLSKVNFVNEGSSTPQLSVPKVAEYKIPLPPMDVQKKIVEECGKIERRKVECLQQISQIQEQKESLFVNAQEHANKAIRLDSSCFEVTIGRRVLKNEVVKDGLLTFIVQMCLNLSARPIIRLSLISQSLLFYGELMVTGWLIVLIKTSNSVPRIIVE